MKLAALLAVLLATPADAQQTPQTQAVDQDDPAVLEVKNLLGGDTDLVDSLAERLLRSRLGETISTEKDVDDRLAAIKAWITDDPDSAARIALGLAQDDVNADSRFEDSLLRQTRTYYADNPGASRNLFGLLRRAAKDSKLLKQQAAELNEDERREIMRSLFEGKGSQTSRILLEKENGKAPSDKTPTGAATSFSGYYDRFDGGNLRGYSPQLLALQSQLNARRPPGASRLIETGKLDYATLSYPSHGMRHDLARLADRLRRENAASPGAPQSPEQNSLAPRLARRAELLEKAREAVRNFDDSAAKGKDPNAVTRSLLIELGRRQREAARWITSAALEEELARLDAEETMFSPELLAAIDAVPVSAAMREAYKKRGTALQAKYSQAKANALRAQKLLLSDEWASRLAEVDRLLSLNQSLRRNLARDAELFSRVPRSINAFRPVRPRWRAVLDNLSARWMPRAPWARAETLRRGRLERQLEIFAQISSGDLDAAAAAFSSVLQSE